MFMTEQITSNNIIFRNIFILILLVITFPNLCVFKVLKNMEITGNINGLIKKTNALAEQIGSDLNSFRFSSILITLLQY